MRYTITAETKLSIRYTNTNDLTTKIDHACEDNEPIYISIGDDGQQFGTWISDQELANTIKMLIHTRKLLKERQL